MICAIGKNREIGCDNKLLWDIPDDMRHFTETTRGKTVIMGQKTYESLHVKPLPNRKNIVLTFDKDFQAPDCEIAFDLEEVAKKYQDSDEEVFVIGGGTIYKQFLPYAQKLYLTLVDDAPKADTFFPDYSEFYESSQGEKKEHNGFIYRFVELIRK